MWSKLRFLFIGLFYYQVISIQAQPAPVIQWQKNFGGTGDDIGQVIKQTSDGGYVIGGYSTSGISGNKTNANYGGGDYWLVKIDANGNKQWDKSFGGTGQEQLWSMQLTTATDGGYVLGGYSNSGLSGNKTNAGFGGDDYWVVKVDANGNKQWDKCFGGTVGLGFSDWLQSLRQTRDGGYILGGYSDSLASGNKTNAGFGGGDFWVVKLDGDGNKLWDKSYGGSGFDLLGDIQQTSDDGYILGGDSKSSISGNKTSASLSNDFWVVKIDVNGNKQWDKSFGGSGYDFIRSLQQTSDGGYIFGGYSDSPTSGNKLSASFGGIDYWIVKLDANGNKQWDKSFGGSGDDQLFCLQQMNDGGYILGGYSFSGISGNKTTTSFGFSDYWLVKTDSDGNKQWEKSFGGSGYEEIRSFAQTSDGGFILGGLSTSGISGNKTNASFGNADYWVVKLLVPLQFNSFSLNANNAQAQLFGIPGTNYIFQGSTDLTNWTSLITNIASTNGIVTFNGTNMGAFSSRFFRAQQKP